MDTILTPRQDWRTPVVVDGRSIPSSVQGQICRAQTLAEFRGIERDMGWTPRQFIEVRRALYQRRYGVKI